MIRLSSAVVVDVDEYREALRGAIATGTSLERAHFLECAMSLSEAPLMDGADEPWVRVERAQVALDRYQALLDLSACRRELGDFEAALSTARRAILIEPEREEARLLAAQALADLGHAADAM